MAKKRILILGGYGGAGLAIAKQLLASTDAELIVAGRSLERAQSAAAKLNGGRRASPVSGRRADAADVVSMRDALRGVDLLLVAATTTEYVEQTARVALDCGVDYLDIHYPQEAYPKLSPLAAEIKSARRCFITQAGFHPGLLSPFIRHAARNFDQVEAARIAMMMRVSGEESVDSAAEIAESMGRYSALVFSDGQWRAASYRDTRIFDFGATWGGRQCLPLWFAELRALPGELGLRDCGAYVAGMGWFVDYLFAPIAMLVFRLMPARRHRWLGALLGWGLRRFSSPPYGVWFQAELIGKKSGRARRVVVRTQCDDAYRFTALPVAACVRQYLRGPSRRPGLWLMGDFVDPAQLLADLRKGGLMISEQIS